MLSWNNSFPWTINFIEKYIDKWDFEGLSQNEKGAYYGLLNYLRNLKINGI